MKAKLVGVVAALQVAVLGFMAGEREWVARTGETVLLRTAPIDPRDPMRGDFVRLDYEIAHVPRRLVRDSLQQWMDQGWSGRGEWRDARVYAEIRVGEYGVAELVALNDEPPAEGRFLRGRVESVDAAAVRVRFGVEAMFMQQGTAKALEDEVRTTRLGVPMNVEVAVGRGGLAVLKGYRWEPLGLTVNLDFRDRAPGAGPRRELTGATVELKNYSDEPVAIVARPNGGSFRLVRNDRMGQAEHRWVGEDQPLAAAAPGHVKVLQPGESHREQIDFSAPKWWVIPPGGAEPVSLGTLENAWNASFRFEYVPPTREEAAGLSNAELIRHGALRSRAFSPVNGID